MRQSNCTSIKLRCNLELSELNLALKLREGLKIRSQKQNNTGATPNQTRRKYSINIFLEFCVLSCFTPIEIKCDSAQSEIGSVAGAEKHENLLTSLALHRQFHGYFGTDLGWQELPVCKGRAGRREGEGNSCSMRRDNSSGRTFLSRSLGALYFALVAHYEF